MTHLRRTTVTALGRPAAGDLIRGESGPAVPINLGPGEELVVFEAEWGRDLIAAATVAVDVLDAEQGLPAAERAPCDGPKDCVHAAAAEALEQERDTYRDLLRRAAAARTLGDLNAAVSDARVSLDQWGRS
ncbi:hypothetical protein ACIBHY_16985 [Nonomuraea sp. NPDC050547]|uniref:hypothetical protein n=1 Tax=Nonomuraea sp. NPDC050547 TaxID=3364368 RepID=UPI0037ABC3F6